MRLSEEETERIIALTVEEFDNELQVAGYRATVIHAPELATPAFPHQIPWRLADMPDDGTPAHAIFNARVRGGKRGAAIEFLQFLVDNDRHYQGA